jgi:hypothetical protein
VALETPATVCGPESPCPASLAYECVPVAMRFLSSEAITQGHDKIRPHRFGGEGVLIGGQTATLNAQSHLLI